MNKLVDSHGRHIHKLRLNLLDACNMRCMYCMPEDTKFMAKRYLLSPDNFFNITKNLIEFGVDEIRLTGGEPFLRSDIKEIVIKLSTLKLKKLGITTNAIDLNKHLEYLKDTSLRNINVSLDSLDENTFHFMTKRNVLNLVLDNVLKAKEMGFTIKLNCVVLRNYNFSEVKELIEFSAKHNIELRFLELMKIGVALDYFEKEFVSADEIIKKISELGHSIDKVPMPIDSTSFNYIVQTIKGPASIGFIASESKPFCGGCSRLRLSADGTLRPCIMVDTGPNLANLDFGEYPKVLAHLIEQKPTGRLEKIERNMNQIGG
jgi:cyclic pyranopterin phosphate synthase